MTQILGRKSIANFDRERLGAAVQRAATANQTPHGNAENSSVKVVAKIEKWLRGKAEITAGELRLQTAEALADFDPDAAYWYKNENKLF